ncbi:MAG: DnaB-like helicase C-terminal domain-containing protein [Rikenellaceae bacterium]
MNTADKTKISTLINSWRPSDLVIIGGRPSMGKTSLMISAAICCARDNSTPVAIFSLELSKIQLITKRILIQYGKNSMKLPIEIDDKPAIDIEYFHSKVKEFTETSGIKVVFIDFLQLMQGDEVSKSLKLIAEELNITIVCFSQLPLSVEDNEGNRPKLSDLGQRASGATEYADSILFIYREAYYDDKTRNKTVELTVAKHHDDSLDCFEFRFEKSDGSIRNK